MRSCNHLFFRAFDIDRDNHGHIAFGYGSHQCIGQILARAEMEIAIPTLLRRMPQLRLDVPLESVDLVTREAAPAAYERSDVCVVPAAGVIGEAMVAIVLAQAFLLTGRREYLDEAFGELESWLDGNPFLRELIIPFGESGYVALFEVENRETDALVVERYAERHAIERCHRPRDT